jgi:prolyl 4-hydroxylase
MQVISLFPRIIVFPNFIDQQRAENIKQLASRTLVRSQLALREHDDASQLNDVRTSSGTFLSAGDDPTRTLSWLDDRIQEVTGVPKENFEV